MGGVPEESNRRSLGSGKVYIEKQRVFDYKVVFGSCRFPVVAGPNRGHVGQWSVLYLAGILSKLGERDAQHNVVS